MTTYEITFDDGSTETVNCNKYYIDGGIIQFVDTDNKPIFIANMYSHVKFIKKL